MPLEASADGQDVAVSTVRDAGRRKKFEEALEKANRKYGRILKGLAE